MVTRSWPAGAAADINEAGLAEVTSAIEEAGGTVCGWQLDVTDGDRVRQVIGEVVDEFGGLDVVINNAGISRGGPIDSDDYEERWEWVLAVLLTAHTVVIRAALPYLRRSIALVS